MAAALPESETVALRRGGPTARPRGHQAEPPAAVGAGLTAQLEPGAALQQQPAATSDFREGVRALREKRRASFSGE